jgi:hypothetical protein
MSKLNSGGKVSIVGHPKVQDGIYNYFKGKDGSYFITKDWTTRYSTYRIGEWFLIKCLNQNKYE